MTTDHPGCREAVTHGVNGLLVPVKNAPALAAAIEELLQDPTLLKNMEKAAREKALAEFDVKLIVADTLKAYENRAL